MSPILIRPVREQIEHDRIIRVLQHRLRREYTVEANLGDDRRVPVRVGDLTLYPDLVLMGTGSSKKLHGIVEVETVESVNPLEAMAEWAHYGRAKAPFHLYVPSGLVEMARRLIEDNHIAVAQLWSYAPVGDQVHFWLVSGDGDGTVIASVTDSIVVPEETVAEPPAAVPVEPPEPTPQPSLPTTKPRPAPPARKAAPQKRAKQVASKPGQRVATVKATAKATAKKPKGKKAASSKAKGAGRVASKARVVAPKRAVRPPARKAASRQRASKKVARPAKRAAARPVKKRAGTVKRR